MIPARDILKKYWGFDSFRPLQEDIINNVVAGLDTVALLPTGGGKSLCFQVPALMQDGVCIVISPLVALMTDQVNTLNSKGIKAIAITGGKKFHEVTTLLDNIRYGNYKFLYISPERLQQDIVQNTIRELNVNCVAIDEAHCISQWGNDFRPAYKQITLLRDLQPLAPIIALTATATPEVLADTIKELELEEPIVFKASFVRENLAYNVLKEDDKIYRVEQLLKHNTKNAIVYVRSRKNAVDTSAVLNSLGIISDYYHGGIPSEEKTKKLQDWKSGITPTMVATNAFGMGIDLATVAHVIHIQLPESLESYFQEAGRAGRDGAHASATIVYNDYDKEQVYRQFVSSLPDSTYLKYVYKKLNNYLQIPYGEGEFTEHSFNFSDFCRTYDLKSIVTYNSLNTLDRMSVIQLSKEFGRSSKLKFIVTSQTLLDYFKHDTKASIIGKTILRLYGGVFETMTTLNLELVKKKTNQSVSTIINVLKKLEELQFVELQLHTTDASIVLLKPREDDKTINVIAREVAKHNEKKKEQVTQVLRYLANETTCRSIQLVNYFGEKASAPCGICTVCTRNDGIITKKERKLIELQLLAILELEPKTSRELCETLTFTEGKIIYVLEFLVENGKLQLDFRNRYTT